MNATSSALHDFITNFAACFNHIHHAWGTRHFFALLILAILQVCKVTTHISRASSADLVHQVFLSCLARCCRTSRTKHTLRSMLKSPLPFHIVLVSYSFSLDVFRPIQSRLHANDASRHTEYAIPRLSKRTSSLLVITLS